MSATINELASPVATGRVELFTRSVANPLLTAADWPALIATVSNPAAAVVNAETLLLCRVEDRHGSPQLQVARSVDGVTRWRVDPEPLIKGNPNDSASAHGVENARVTWVGELSCWVITYTALGPEGPCVALAKTTDFRDVEYLGVAIQPDNKDGCLLPRRVDGDFILFHRPTSAHTGRADIWLSRSADLRSWSAPQPVLAAREGEAWDSTKVGMGPPPLATPYGWLGIYHGVSQLPSGPVYRAGLVLLDLEAPERILRRSYDWILAPAQPYERTGNAPNVLFPSGLVHDRGTDELRLYYGCAETVVAMASAPLIEVIEYLLSCPKGGS